MKTQLAAVLIVVLVGLSQAHGSGKEEEAYLAYWLTSDPPAKDPTQYEPVLLVTRLPLEKLQPHFDLQRLRDHLLKPDDDQPLLEALALTIETYRKDSIWNVDRRPLKSVRGIANVNAEKRRVEVNGKTYRYEDCPLANVVRLIERPEGKVPLHRREAPLAGAKQTARALRLLIKEQLASEKRE